MGNLLTADVIRAAASSFLGIMSLRCLIVGIVALTFFKNASDRAKIFVFVLLLFGIAGFAIAFLNPRLTNQIPEASRPYVIGRWQVEQKIAGIEGASFVDYFEDGSFSGRQETFIAGRGGSVPVSGAWDFTKLANDQFRLTLNFNN